MRGKCRGFTLVELLVVITIVVILSTVALPVFTNVQKAGRDTKRKADIHALLTAIETYYWNTGKYPGWANCHSATIPPGYTSYWNWSSCDSGNWDTAADDIASLLVNAGLMRELPKDTINNDQYNYLYEAWPETYIICANLEAGSGGFSFANHNYCLKGGCISCH
jgi:prepilin-type N-terminal cleavage/methylation domain-containing protein